MTDIPARDALPFIVKTARSMMSEFDIDERADIESMLNHLEGWKGTFSETEIAPTVYSYWQLNFYRSLFYK